MPISSIPLLDLTRQYRSLKPALDAAVGRVLAGGSFILGPEVQRFEEEFSHFCGVRFGIGVASGTDALELSLRALGIGAGDLVATAAFTFCATVDAIVHVGAEPFFVDIDAPFYTLSPSDLEARLSSLGSRARRVKAVIPVHLYGHPCDMDGIRKVAHRYRLSVVEDAAQAAGARWKGNPVGSLGDLGCFSFFPTKTLGAFGDGGMVVASNKELARRLKLLRVHGRSDRQQQRMAGGRNSRLDELQAAILRRKLRALPRWIEKRNRLADRYTARLSCLPKIQAPAVADGAEHAFCLYVVRSANRPALQRALSKARIAHAVYYSIPMHRQPIYLKKYRALSLPETERASRQVLALPLFPELTDKEVDRVCDVIQSAI